MEGQFHFLALWHTTNSEKTYGIIWPRGPHQFRLGLSRIFNSWIWRKFEWHKIQFLHKHGMTNHLGSIQFSYVWLCNWEHPFSTWPKRENPRALHVSQALLWRTALTWWSTMQFLCTPATQLVHQPCTTLSCAFGSEIHHQEPQPVGFSHIGWSELLLTNYKAKETSLVSCEHNRKTERCLAHLCLLPFPRTHAF